MLTKTYMCRDYDHIKQGMPAVSDYPFVSNNSKMALRSGLFGRRNEKARCGGGLVHEPRKVSSVCDFILSGNSCRVTPGVDDSIKITVISLVSTCEAVIGGEV